MIEVFPEPVCDQTIVWPGCDEIDLVQDRAVGA
jgi:hypothetical protein